MNKSFDVSVEQLAHEFAMLKIQKQLNEGKINTYGDMYNTYIDELDTMKIFLKDKATS